MASQDEKASIDGVPRSIGRHGALDPVATMQEFSVFPASPVTRDLYCTHLRAPCVAAQPNEKPPSGPKAAPRCGDIGCGCRVGKQTKPPSFPSGSTRAALWTTRDFGLVADVTVIIKKAARPFSPFDRRAALKVSTQQVTVLLRGRDALTQITKIGCEKAAERPGGPGGEKAGQGPAATLRLILA